MKLTRILFVGWGLFSSIVATTYSHTAMDIIVSAAPPQARVIIAPPRGHSRCYVTPPRWVEHVWIPAHQECIYARGPATTWVSGYWGCLTVGPRGTCARWQWTPAHWMAQQPSNFHGHPQTNDLGHEHEHEHEHEVTVPAYRR
jgi:hypothetical protein